jgi:hypothetical protein
MIGPKYGDFHIPKTWANDATKFLEVTQDRGSIWRLEVRQFVPPAGGSALDLKGRPMYFVPWAIADPESAVKALNQYIDESVGFYLDTLLDDSNHLVWDIFHSAIRLSVFPTPVSGLRLSEIVILLIYYAQVKILENVLRLWAVCRFIESGWRCCGNETLNSQDIKDPFRGDDWISPPPYIDYQMSSIIMHRILAPLRRVTLNGLQNMILANKPSNWYIIFLTTFILLHNYELSIAFQRSFSTRRKAAVSHLYPFVISSFSPCYSPPPFFLHSFSLSFILFLAANGLQVRYIDMPLVRASHSGAKTILAHFHYCCKGQEPFQPGFNWKSPQIQKMVQLDAEQIAFMEKFAELVHKKCKGRV